MRRIGIILMGTPLAAWLALTACGGSDSTFGPGDNNNGGDGGDNNGGGGFGEGGTVGEGGLGGDGGLAQCATGASGTTRAPVYLDIVLDGSQSMDGHGPPNPPAKCDADYKATPPGPDCFLEGRREIDPLQKDRTTGVCDKGDTQATCTAFKGKTGKKWIAARGALTAYFSAQTQSPNLGVGLFLFSSTNSKDVEIAPVNATQKNALNGVIQPGTWPTGGTPLLKSVQQELADLKNFTPSGGLKTGGQRVLLMMTDGVPNPDVPDQNDKDQAAIKAAVGAANTGKADGIRTFVVGIGDPTEPALVYNAQFLSRVASVGGASPVGCNPEWINEGSNGTPCHYQVTPGADPASKIQAEIAAAIDKASLVGQSCVLPLDHVSADLDPSKVNVIYTSGTGQESQLPTGANGWTLNSPPSKVTLNGAACTKLQADAKAKVDIVIGCKTGDPVIH